MNMLQDSEMVEVIDDFIAESSTIYDELDDILDDYEDEPSAAKLEHFGQVIDRVMGAAKSVDANLTGTYCDLGKTISYKASQSMDQNLLDITLAVLFDTVEILKKMMDSIKKSRIEEVSDFNLEAFGSRLHWLAEKFKNIQRSSVAIAVEDETQNDQKSIDELLADLGL